MTAWRLIYEALKQVRRHTDDPNKSTAAPVAVGAPAFTKCSSPDPPLEPVKSAQTTSAVSVLPALEQLTLDETGTMILLLAGALFNSKLQQKENW